MKRHNFYAGPAILSPFTIDNTAKAVTDFEGSGLSILEISHRSKEFMSVISNAQELFKELLNIPKGYHVLFLAGGASTQFFYVPYNLLNKKAAYLTTGSWAGKAIKEAYHFGEVIEVASSKDTNFNYIPQYYTVPEDADYLHITTNNTIFGTAIKKDLNVSIPLVADMSSDILSRPIDISKYSLIYGGAQKNLGPAGVTFVIINENVLGKVDRQIPTMVNYRTHIKNESMFNTPPCLPIYSLLQTLIWVKNNGGVKQIHKYNIEKAEILYNEIERNKLFKCTVEKEEDKSIMNICFTMNEEYKDLEKNFIKYATEKGMVGIKGHRSVGGFRASIYNAMPKESVSALVKAMQEFKQTI